MVLVLEEDGFWVWSEGLCSLEEWKQIWKLQGIFAAPFSIFSLLPLSFSFDDIIRLNYTLKN